MMGGGERHPLQVMAILHDHYGRLARLDGVDAAIRGDGRRGDGDQARLPGQEGARPTTAGSVAAGSSGRSSCSPRPTSTCAAQRDSPDELVMEVLVARLSLPRRRR